jgi:hypothetical protein
VEPDEPVDDDALEDALEDDAPVEEEELAEAVDVPVEADEAAVDPLEDPRLLPLEALLPLELAAMLDTDDPRVPVPPELADEAVDVLPPLQAASSNQSAGASRVIFSSLRTPMTSPRLFMGHTIQISRARGRARLTFSAMHPD